MWPAGIGVKEVLINKINDTRSLKTADGNADILIARRAVINGQILN